MSLEFPRHATTIATIAAINVGTPMPMPTPRPMRSLWLHPADPPSDEAVAVGSGVALVTCDVFASCVGSLGDCMSVVAVCSDVVPGLEIARVSAIVAIVVVAAAAVVVVGVPGFDTASVGVVVPGATVEGANVSSVGVVPPSVVVDAVVPGGVGPALAKGPPADGWPLPLPLHSPVSRSRSEAREQAEVSRQQPKPSGQGVRGRVQVAARRCSPDGSRGVGANRAPRRGDRLSR